MTGRPCEDYFDLQLRFAGRYAALTGAPHAEAVALCTNLRRRFGWWGTAGDARWSRFLSQVEGCDQHEDRLRLAMAAYASAARPSPSPFGCFSYDPPDAQGVLRLHFMPDERHRKESPLSGKRLPERRDELRALFMEVRRLHPAVRQVRGLSWLYHLQAYRRLFPPAYVASVAPPTDALHMTGSSTWGQVLDYRHRLKAGVAARVLAGLEASNVSTPWRAFPLQPLAAACAVDDFLDGYP